MSTAQWTCQGFLIGPRLFFIQPALSGSTVTASPWQGELKDRRRRRPPRHAHTLRTAKQFFFDSWWQETYKILSLLTRPQLCVCVCSKSLDKILKTKSEITETCGDTMYLLLCAAGSSDWLRWEEMERLLSAFHSFLTWVTARMHYFHLQYKHLFYRFRVQNQWHASASPLHGGWRNVNSEQHQWRVVCLFIQYWSDLFFLSV